MSISRTFREIGSGRRRGLGASLARAVLRAAEGPYSWAVRWRNNRYDRGRAKTHQVGAVVVSVGNLTLGGTGKTPMVKWIVRWLANHSFRVSIVSRGYGAKSRDKNDEARELEQSLPDVPHVQNRDRVAAARKAIDQFGAQIIVADDAFQHRRLARHLEIVLIDALEPFGFGHLFPRGMLREPIDALKRAEVVCLTRADMVDQARRDAIRQQVAMVNSAITWCEVAHAPTELIAATGERRPLDHLRGRRVAAFCGIGNPTGFRHTLSAMDCELAGWREFADHHDYGADDLRTLRGWVSECAADLAVCTHKDLVKLQVQRLAETPLWAVAIEIQFLHGADQLEAALWELVKPDVEA